MDKHIPFSRLSHDSAQASPLSSQRTLQASPLRTVTSQPLPLARGIGRFKKVPDRQRTIGLWPLLKLATAGLLRIISRALAL